MTIIDAHIHFGDGHPELLDLLEELDLKLLNIGLTVAPGSDWREKTDCYRQLSENHPQRFGWCTTFDLPHFDDPEYVPSVIAGLEQDFAQGAVACKVWKNVGMEVRLPDGSFMLPDHELLDPIWDYLAQAGRTLLAHIAEPRECWLPLQEGTPHYGYYSRNPQWHMYNRPEYHSHAALIAARDRIMEKHPTLRFVGAHLGSLDYDVDEVAMRLDRYPNFAVDISARLSDMAVQDSAKVREFCIKYADRILFGTDVVMRQAPSNVSPQERAEILTNLRQLYEMHFAYLESGHEVTVRDYTTEGLALPSNVLEQIYTMNAQRWYPGL